MENQQFWIRERHLQMVGIFHWLGVLQSLSNTDFSSQRPEARSKDWIARPWLSLWCKTGGLQEFLLQLAVVSWLDFLCVQKPLHEVVHVWCLLGMILLVVEQPVKQQLGVQISAIFRQCSSDVKKMCLPSHDFSRKFLFPTHTFC